MTADERRQFDMLVRVRNFGNNYAALWASSPAAVQALARVGSTIDGVTVSGMSKTAAAAARRSDRRFALRHELRGLLRRAARLSRNLRAEGQQIQVLEWRGSKGDTALITAAGYFAKEMANCDEFRTHGMAPERITTLATLLDRAVMEQVGGYSAFTLARGPTPRSDPDRRCGPGCGDPGGMEAAAPAGAAADARDGRARSGPPSRRRRSGRGTRVATSRPSPVPGRVSRTARRRLSASGTSP